MQIAPKVTDLATIPRADVRKKRRHFPDDVPRTISQTPDAISPDATLKGGAT